MLPTHTALLNTLLGDEPSPPHFSFQAASKPLQRFQAASIHPKTTNHHAHPSHRHQHPISLSRPARPRRNPALPRRSRQPPIATHPAANPSPARPSPNSGCRPIRHRLRPRRRRVHRITHRHRHRPRHRHALQHPADWHSLPRCRRLPNPQSSLRTRRHRCPHGRSVLRLFQHPNPSTPERLPSRQTQRHQAA